MSDSPSSERRQILPLGIMLAIGVLGAAVIVVASPHGLGVRGDSVTYMAAAENMLAGRGFSRPTGIGVKPLTHFPPLFPVVLAAEHALGIPLMDAARWTNAFLFGVNIILIGWLVMRMARSPWLGVAASGLALLSPSLQRNHLWVMSEPLFLTLCLVSLLALASYLEAGRLWRLVLAAAAASLALLNRYAAGGLAAAGFLGLAWIPGVSKRRLRDLSLFTVIVALPMVFWFLRNTRVSGTAANRLLVFHPLTSTEWKGPVELVWTWLVPFKFTTAALYGTAGLLGLLLLGVGIYALVIGGQARRRAVAGLRSQPLLALVSLFLAAYTVLVLVSKLFLDAATPIDERIALPVYVGLMALLLTGWSQLARRWGRTWWFVAASVLLLAFLVASYLPRTLKYLDRSRTTALGYTTGVVFGSDVSTAASELGPELILYTNEPELLYFLTHRSAYMIPHQIDTATLQSNPEFESSFREMQQRLDRGEAALVLYISLADRPDLPTEEQLAQGRPSFFRGKQGTIYLLPGE